MALRHDDSTINIVIGIIIGSRPSDHYFRSVRLSVCLCRVFLSRLWSNFDQTWTYVICLGLVVLCPLEYKGCATLGDGWPLKNCIFRGFGARKTISSYSFGCPDFWLYCTTHQYWNSFEPFFAISILNPNYDVIDDVISGFAKVVVERCGFHHWIAQRISCGEVVSVFLYIL